MLIQDLPQLLNESVPHMYERSPEQGDIVQLANFIDLVVWRRSSRMSPRRRGQVSRSTAQKCSGRSSTV